MAIYTKQGDTGDTSLYGGARITKSHLRIEAYGQIDELNAAIGVALSHNPAVHQEQLQEIQQELFVLGSHLATQHDPGSVPKELPDFPESALERMEKEIDAMEKELPELTHFIVPSGSAAGAALHLARTICRRAERTVVRLSHEEEILPLILQYLNRLSDYLFTVARAVNHAHGETEREWKK